MSEELRPCPYHGDPNAMKRDTVCGEYAYCEKCNDGDRKPGIWFRPIEDWNNCWAWREIDSLREQIKQLEHSEDEEYAERKRWEVEYCTMLERANKYCARNEKLVEIIRRGLIQMKSINGDDEKCVIRDPFYCPNHTWIHNAEKALTKKEL